MPQQSLIIRYSIIENAIHIIDIHHDVIMKKLPCKNDSCFAPLDKAVRSGEITFDYLLSEEVQSIDDIETDTTLKDVAIGASIEEVVDASVNDFEVGDKAIYQGIEYIIMYFNFDIEPITARIALEHEGYVVPVMELTRPDAPTQYIKDMKVYMKGKPQPYYFQTYINDHYCTLARSTNPEDIEFTVRIGDVYIPQQESEHTGGSSSYYITYIEKPTTLDTPYQAECNDMIEALEMTPAEAGIFKAVWRTAAKRQGKGTCNSVDLAKQIIFSGKRMLVKADKELPF